MNLSSPDEILIKKKKVPHADHFMRDFYGATKLVSRVLCPFGPRSSICATRCRVACAFTLPPRENTAGNRRACARSHGVASDRVYMTPPVTKGMVSSYLAFPSLPLARRFISVALFLRSPSADVIRYPALRSPDFPRHTTFRHGMTRPRRFVARLLYHCSSFLSTERPMIF